ncbi:MAG: hypothetical protein JW959_04070 [Pirellulales bacterium]|nr:hypothetical protein [Pirellulales bacterium]
MNRIAVTLYILLAAVGISTVCAAEAATADSPREQYLRVFRRLCDANAKALNRPKTSVDVHSWGCFDAYVVRALAVAYDLDAKKEYLEECKKWADQTIEHQKRMVPKGAYYMHYGRKPGEDREKWYVADSSSIAMGVLATVVRCDDPAEKNKYLDSVKLFFKLVAENWVRPSGGVANGHWPKSDKEFWCATGTFGSLAFLLYKETGDPDCLAIGRGAIDWLNRQDLMTVARDFYPEETIKPSVIMYCLEAYSAGLPYLEKSGRRREEALSQLAKNHAWILLDFSRAAKADYLTHWGSKRGGLPFHLYAQAESMPNGDELTAAADKQLNQLVGIVKDSPATGKLAAFAILSFAEKIAPGGLYRCSKRDLP